MKSNDLEVHFAERLLDQYPRLAVDLKRAELTVAVEIREGRAFVSYETIAGVGGLPAGSSGRLMAMLSGGIDSPVACYQMMRRGCELDFVTFHSAPYTPPELLSKVASLVRLLNEYQKPGRLFAVNLLPAQKAIRDVCRERYRTILYRRMMVRLSCALAEVRGGRALVTGDNIGQVASQTLENLTVVSHASQLLIMRPVLAADKVDTVEVARRIGSFDLSNQEVPDSCTVFAPGNPATASDLERVLREEERLDVSHLLRECAVLTRVLDPDTLEEAEVDGLADAVSRLTSL